MTYKTHLAVGYASALIITSPSSLSELVTCLGISTVGSIISDIDATTSESRKDLGKVVAITLTGIAAVFAGDLFLGLDTISKFRGSEYIMRIITGFLALIAVCIFGEHQPHRSFMHSLAGTASVTLCFYIIIPDSFKYILISMLSHIIIDTLNRKKIRLFYPLKKPSIGFGICYSNGLVNKLLFILAGIYAASEVIIILYRCFF